MTLPPLLFTLGPPTILLALPLAIFLVQHYASPGTALSVRLLTVISFWLGFLGIVLLPLDLSLTTRFPETNDDVYATDDDAFHDIPEVNETYQPWLVTYWSTFILAWMVLPPIRKALLSGHFTALTRIRDALLTSFRMYVILLGLLLGAIAFLAIRLHSWHVMPILMALSNTYGLLLVALLLGYGLVDLPRKMWRRADPTKELRRTQILANAADEALFDAVWELQDCEDEIDSAVCRIDAANAAAAAAAAAAANGDGDNNEGGMSMARCLHEPPPCVPEWWLEESDGRMSYDECVQELVRRRNLTANLGTQLESRRTKKRTSVLGRGSSSGSGMMGGSSGHSSHGGGVNGSMHGSSTHSAANGGTVNTRPPSPSPPGGPTVPPRSPRRAAGGYSPPNSADEAEADAADESSLARPTIKDLALLNARLKLAQARLVSAEQNWTELVERSQLYSARVNNDFSLYALRAETSCPPTAPLLDKINVRFESFGGRVRYLWITRLVGPTSRLLSCLFAVLSGLVLWSEATMAAPWNLSPISWFLNLLDGDTVQDKGLLFAVAALVPLLYMSACTYSSLFKISFFGPYCLRGYKQSHGVALVFNAQYLIRMQFPLGYNYLLMLRYDTTSTNCAFSRVMSDMDTVPFFGTSFSVYAPLLILALCCFTLCDGYPRLLGMLGLEHEDAILMGDRETLDRQVNEGIILLRRHVERGSGSAHGSENGGRRSVGDVSGHGVGGGSRRASSTSSSLAAVSEGGSSHPPPRTPSPTTVGSSSSSPEGGDGRRPGSDSKEPRSSPWWYGVV